jgi:hypothetical protein
LTFFAVAFFGIGSLLGHLYCDGIKVSSRRVHAIPVSPGAAGLAARIACQRSEYLCTLTEHIRFLPGGQSGDEPNIWRGIGYRDDDSIA